MDCFARAGGGGGGRGSGILGIILAPFVLIYAWYVNTKLNAKNARVERALAEISKTDPKWAEDKLLGKGKQRFFELQQAWSTQDLQTMKKLLHPLLYPSWEAQIKMQINNHQKNIMSGVAINRIRIVDARNYRDDERDCFTACIDAWADDQTIQNGTLMASKKGSFREFWTFEWHEKDWVLLDVSQSNAWRKFVLMDIVYEQNSKSLF